MITKEKLLIIVPVHNYQEGILRLEQFANENISKIINSWELVFVDNMSSNGTKDVLNKIKSDKINVLSNNIECSLKDSLSLAFNYYKNFNPTIVSIWESDCIPSLSVLESMIKTLIQERQNGAVSVSPMYKWNNTYCYPVHKHWFTDNLYKTTKDSKISITHAVPFLFSVWEASALEYINKPNFRKFIGLDTDFGKYLTSIGKKHLRLLDKYVIHINGGKNSWK